MKTPNFIPRIASALAFVCLIMGALAKPASYVRCSVPPLAEDLRPQLGAVGLVRNLRPASFSFDKAVGQVESAADRTATATGNLLGTHTSESSVNVPLGAVTFVLAPIVAGHAAIFASHERLNHKELSECEQNLANAMKEMAAQESFQA